MRRISGKTYIDESSTYMTAQPIQAVAVFCGSQAGDHPMYPTHAEALGRGLAVKGIRLVYGGGAKGLMGAVANAHLEAGGHVTGIIPQILSNFEHQHTGLTELVITKDMHERKRLLYERCDAAIVLPGGFGTLDELFEMLTWNQLSIHDKPIAILNTSGFYGPLMQYLLHLEKSGFLYGHLSDRVRLYDTPEALLDALPVLRS